MGWSNLHAWSPAKLMITDGRQGRSKAPAVKSRDFHMSIVEARAASDVAGVHLLLSYKSLFMILLLLSCINMSKCTSGLYFSSYVWVIYHLHTMRPRLVVQDRLLV